METAGVPGKVHITQATRDFLDDSYMYEPGNGDQRHAALEGITTYLITGKKKKHEKKNSSRNNPGRKRDGDSNAPPKKVSLKLQPLDMVTLESQIDHKNHRSNLKRKSEEIMESDILNSSVTSDDDYAIYNGRRPSQVDGATSNEAIARAKLRTTK